MLVTLTIAVITIIGAGVIVCIAMFITAMPAIADTNIGQCAWQ